MVTKNERGLLGLRTLKSAVSQEWIDELGWFLAYWYKFMKAKSYFNNCWVSVVKNGRGLKIVGLLNQVYLTNDLKNWADWLNEFCMLIDSDGIIFYSTLYLWHLNAGSPLQLYLARGFGKNSLCAKMTRK